MKHKALELSEEDRAGLQKIVSRGSDWRERERAQTVLYFGEGWSVKEITAKQGLNRDTVNDRRKFWLERGFTSLVDKPRSGAPAKLTPAHQERLREVASTEALTARELLDKLKEEFDVNVHPATLIQTLKRMKFAWKRTRHSLKKNETK